MNDAIEHIRRCRKLRRSSLSRAVDETEWLCCYDRYNGSKVFYNYTLRSSCGLGFVQAANVGMFAGMIVRQYVDDKADTALAVRI